MNETLTLQVKQFLGLMASCTNMIVRDSIKWFVLYI